MLLAMMSVAGQTFNINIAFESNPRGKVTLSLYDSDTTPRVMRKKVSKRLVSFSGQVKQPCYAEINTAKGQKLGFFVENSDISIRFNNDNPETSPVTGSRVNSQYRYILEQCRQEDGSYNTSALVAQVKEQPSAVYSPLIIYRYIMPRSDMETVKELTGLLEGDATTSYHYRIINSYTSTPLHPYTSTPLHPYTSTPQHPYTLTPFSDLSFFDANHQQCRVDTLLKDSTYNLIIVGATWCQQCKNAYSIVHNVAPDINIIVVNIDDDKRLWDADIIKKLNIEHIPYLILINPDKTIKTQDLRPWEVARFLIEN